MGPPVRASSEILRVTAKISKVSASGDGVIEMPDEPPVYVRGAYLGDRVTAAYEKSANGRYRLGRIEAFEHREGVKPPCEDFPACGGCRLQQWPEQAYRQRLWESWETHARRLTAARASCDWTSLERSSFWGSPYERRRAQVHWSGEEVGFYAPESHRIVPMRRCHVLEPGLWDGIARWRQLPKPLPSGSLRLQAVGDAWEGVLESDAPSSQTEATRKKLDRWWQHHGLESGLDRLVWHDHVWGETVLERRMGPCMLRVPPGAFMQASDSAERWMQSWVRRQWETLGRPEKILDLYAGLGTLSLPLLGGSVFLRTVEGWLPAVTALLHGRWDDATGQPKPYAWQDRRHEHWDIQAGSLPAAWLASVGMAIVNPPRSGGERAYRALASARVPSVLSVTCHIPSWERDVRVLVETGYRLQAVACVDQFLWSGHSEWMTLWSL